MAGLSGNRVVILLPVYNEKEKSLKDTVKSVQLLRGPLKLELFIVVDGGGLDSLVSLKIILGIEGKLPDFESSELQEYHGSIAGDSNSRIIFTIVYKVHNSGKHDSIRFFLEYLRKEVNLENAAYQRAIGKIVPIQEILRKSRLSVVMLDSDTIIAPDSVQLLFSSIWSPDNEDVFGASGLTLPRWTPTNFLQSAQDFEFRTQQATEKAAQSALGYVLCLQGAFCMFKAADLLDAWILEKLSETPDNIFSYNRCRSGEDRYITTLLLSTGKRSIFVSHAQAFTSCPSALSTLILQRRRWNNSVISNNLHILLHHFKGLSWARRGATFLIKIFVFFEMGCFLCVPAVVLRLCLDAVAPLLQPEGDLSGRFFEVSSVIFFSFTVLAFNYLHPESWKRFYRGLNASISVLFLYGLFLYLKNLVSSQLPIYNYSMGYSYKLSVGVMDAAPAFMLGSLLVILMISLVRIGAARLSVIYSALIYTLHIPLFLLVMPVYAMANFDDLSWGTRGLSSKSTVPDRIADKKLSKYLILGSFFVATWLSNIVITHYFEISIFLVCTVFICTQLPRVFLILFLFKPSFANSMDLESKLEELRTEKQDRAHERTGTFN